MNYELKVWETQEPWLEALLWWCEDEVCDCTQPQIDRVIRNLKSGYPFILRTEVWRGTFYSQPDPLERKEQVAELRKAARLYKIPLGKGYYGCCPEVSQLEKLEK